MSKSACVAMDVVVVLWASVGDFTELGIERESP
jgi:hypothetical protein